MRVDARSTAKAAIAVVAVLALVALLADLLVSTPHDSGSLEESTSAELFFRWVEGTRYVVLASTVVVAVSLPSGFILGGLAAIGPPVLETLLRRLVELTGAVPTLLLVAIVQTTGAFPAWAGTALAISLAKTVEIGRIVHVRTRQMKSDEFVVAARAVGASAPSLLRAHLAPHVLPAALVSAAFAASAVVSVDAALAFVGLAPTGGAASWGGWIGEAAKTGAWTAAFWPAASIAIATGALYTLAEQADARLRTGQALVALARSRARTK